MAVAGSLDALNFLLADVRGALGPYRNVFLVTQQHWSQSEVGIVTTAGGLLGLALQTPAGLAIDATRRKRALVVATLAVLAAGAVVIFAAPRFWPVLAVNAAMAAVGDVFGPAVGALTLGLFARSFLARRMGRNAAFDHAGNVAIAVLAGGVGWAASQRAVFLLASVLECCPLLVHAGCAMLLGLADALLLPLVGQKLVATMMFACIIAAEAIMLPAVMLVNRAADRLGRNPLLLVGLTV